MAGEKRVTAIYERIPERDDPLFYEGERVFPRRIEEPAEIAET